MKEEVEEYVGCEIVETNDRIILHQSRIIRKILTDFENDIEDMKEYKSPMSSGSHVMRPQEDDYIMTGKELTRYQSGAGSLLYLTKHSRPDISNSVLPLFQNDRDIWFFLCSEKMGQFA